MRPKVEIELKDNVYKVYLWKFTDIKNSFHCLTLEEAVAWTETQLEEQKKVKEANRKLNRGRWFGA